MATISHAVGVYVFLSKQTKRHFFAHFSFLKNLNKNKDDYVKVNCRRKKIKEK